MNYNETLEYLYNAAPAFEKVGAGAYKEGLSNTLALDEHFNHPHRRFKSIHVAGTNGKGSTSHSLAAILQEAGYKVGLYTSPHLVDFNERIRVNGKPIDHQYVIDFVEQEKDFFEPLFPSFFEITTALAFKYFAEQEIDIAVIEVGLGGRLDCTNIISPTLSIITNISFDHTGFLGDTLAKIAGEKAGIIKPHTPVVIGEYTDETRPVFLQKAREMDSSIIFADEYDGILPECQLKGLYQQKNVRTVMTAVKELIRQGILQPSIMQNFSTPQNPLLKVCDHTGLRGRWETIQTSPLVICDTGHNLAGWEYLSEQISSTYTARRRGRLRIVFGMVDDKDVHAVLKLLPKDAIFYFTQAETHRAIPVEKLATYAMKHNINGTLYHTVKEAYTQALKDSLEDDFIFVGGSSYVVADFLS